MHCTAPEHSTLAIASDVMLCMLSVDLLLQAMSGTGTAANPDSDELISLHLASCVLPESGALPQDVRVGGGVGIRDGIEERDEEGFNSVTFAPGGDGSGMELGRVGGTVVPVVTLRSPIPGFASASARIFSQCALFRAISSLLKKGGGAPACCGRP